MWLALQDSEVRRFLFPGLAALVLAVISWLGDRRRMRRTDPDAVGLMPWRDLSFWSSIAAMILLGFAAHSALLPD